MIKAKLHAEANPMLTQTPEPPYYAVIFTSLMSEDDKGYAQVSNEMVRLARKQKGFLGIDSVRNGLGITVSYWSDLEAIELWKANLEHQLARQKGREQWYKAFSVRIAKVEKAYSFDRKE